MRVAVFPGSFDPLTKGHEEIIRKAVPLFDKIYVAIGENANKKTCFPLEQRQQWIKQIFADEPRIEVAVYHGLTIDFCKKNNISVIVRGVRNATDLDTENAINYANKMLLPEIETIYIPTSAQYAGISSTAVREILTHNGDSVSFVPQSVYASIIRSFKSIK